jgi:hypothetical protein
MVFCTNVPYSVKEIKYSLHIASYLYELFDFIIIHRFCTDALAATSGLVFQHGNTVLIRIVLVPEQSNLHLQLATHLAGLPRQLRQRG